MKFIVTLAILLLTLFPVSSTCQPKSSGQTQQKPAAVLIRAWICAYALKYHVEPAAAMAVAHIESRKGHLEFRTGRMGRTYYGPMGIHKCFLNQGADDPEKNIDLGVKALARRPNLKQSLRKYNTEFNEAYWREVVKARKKYRQVGIGG